MATLKVEIVAGGTTYTRTKTVSASDLTRLLNYWHSVFGADLTNTEAFDAWVSNILSGARAQVRVYEQNTAVATDIAFT